MDAKKSARAAAATDAIVDVDPPAENYLVPHEVALVTQEDEEWINEEEELLDDAAALAAIDIIKREIYQYLY